MQAFDNTLIVVTGASTGIGRHAVQTILSEIDQSGPYPNQKPTVIGISRRPITDLDSKNFTSKTADLSKPAQVERVFNEIDADFPSQKISVVIANAGMAKAVPLLSDQRLLDTANPDNSYENAVTAFSGMLNLNVLGLALCLRKAVEKMDHQFPGYIINLNSMSGHRVANSPITHFYSSTKHAVTAVTEGVRQELRRVGKKNLLF